MAVHELGAGLMIQTRARGGIPNERRPERNPAALKASVDLFKQILPDADLRSITATYNCIGMVVANRRAWVEPDQIVRVLLEDDYKKLGGPEQTEFGDVVIYRDGAGEICHAGIVLGKNVLSAGAAQDFLTIVSKWGADGEYIHAASYVPALLGTPVEFWTDRRTA